MLKALDDLLAGYPGYRSPLDSGNINKEDWVWDLACHGPAGPQACNPLFLSNIIPGQNSLPNSDFFVMGAALGPGGFGIGVPDFSDVAGLQKAAEARNYFEKPGGRSGSFYMNEEDGG